MDDNQITRLANAGHQLRPDWPVGSLKTFLGKHFGTRAYRDVALVLANVATVQPATETPRLMLEDWPWQITGTADRRSDAERHPSGASNTALCTHCARTEDHCQAPGVQQQDPHPFATAHELAVERARQDRRPDPPEWTPDGAIRPGGRMPDRYRREMQAAIDAAKHATRPERHPGTDNGAPRDSTDPDTHHEAQNGAQEET